MGFSSADASTAAAPAASMLLQMEVGGNKQKEVDSESQELPAASSQEQPPPTGGQRQHGTLLITEGKWVGAQRPLPLPSPSSKGAIELIVLYARMKNTEHKMAPPPLPWSLDTRVTEVEMMEFSQSWESVSGECDEEEDEEALELCQCLQLTRHPHLSLSTHTS